MSYLQTRFDETAKAKFIATVVATDNLSAACRAVGISRTTLSRHLQEDPDFAQALQQARDEAADELEGIVRARAIHGTPKRLWYKGEPVIDPETGEQAVEVEYNVVRELAMLKAAKPMRYRDRADVNVTGQVEVNFTAAEIVERVNRAVAMAKLDYVDAGEAVAPGSAGAAVAAAAAAAPGPSDEADEVGELPPGIEEIL